MHKIRCGELSSSIIANNLFSCEFAVNDTFYRKLQMKPKYLRNRNNHTPGNAYVFGKQFVKGYKLIGSHGNDAAQTGLLDITGIKKKEYAILHDYKAWNRIYKRGFNLDDPALLVRVRQEISQRILFVGETHGGDVGANVYAHQDNHGQINGLIIDNDCVFK